MMKNLHRRLFVFCLLFFSIAFSADAVSEDNDSDFDFFIFKNRPEVNFHHFLYWCARNTHESVPELCVEKLEDGDRRLMEQLISLYQEFGANQHILFSYTKLSNMNVALLSENTEDLRNNAQLYELFLMGLEIYKQQTWQEHQSTNKRWITKLQKMLTSHGGTMLDDINDAFQPTLKHPKKTEVDVVFNEGKNGAYSSSRMNRIVISSGLDDYAGWGGFEMIFHELVHTYGATKDDPIRLILKTKLDARSAEQHSDFWHCLLFYTVGKIVQDIIPETFNYQPYAYKNQLYVNEWYIYEMLLQKFWTPYLESSNSMYSALGVIVDKLNNMEIH